VIDLHRCGRTADNRWSTFCDDYATFGKDVAACVQSRAGQPGSVAPRGPRIDLVGSMSRRDRARLEKAALAGFGNLTWSDRRAIMLVADGRSTREIARRINRSPGQVSKILTAARREVIAGAFRQAGIDRGRNLAGRSDEEEPDGDARTEGSKGSHLIQRGGAGASRLWIKSPFHRQGGRYTRAI